MKFMKIFTLLMFVFTLFVSSPVSAQSAKSLDYYWGIGCSHCENIKPLMERLEREYPEVTFNRYEIFQNQKNFMDFQKRMTSMGIPREHLGTPTVVINGKVLGGDIDIKRDLENELKQMVGKTSEPEVVATSVAPTDTSISFLAITSAAFVDSINPCAIMVLIVLLSSLSVYQNSNRRLLITSAAFIGSVYVTYFLVGIGFIFAVGSFSMSNIIYKVVGAIALLVGLGNMKDYFAYGAGGFAMEIPQKWRPKLMKLILSVTSPIGAAGIGAVVTMFELPCTGGPYMFALTLLSQTNDWNTVLPYLLYYNLIFISPLIVITALVYKGKTSIERAETWQKDNLKRLHLVAGVIMSVLGIWMILK